MELIVTSTYAFLRGRVPAHVHEAVVNVLRYREPGYQHTTLFKLHKWDGWRNLWGYSPDGGGIYFPAGLVHRVLPEMQKHSCQPVMEHRVPYVTPVHSSVTHLPDGLALYEDQVQVIQQAVQQQRGIFALATNFGKTETIAALAYAFQDQRVLVLGASRKLLDDGLKTVSARLGERIGVWGSGRHYDQRVTFATVQAMARVDNAKVKALLERTTVLLVDEGDTVTPKQWFGPLATCPAPVRLSLSGTMKYAPIPEVVEAFFGPVLMRVEQRELMEQGRSAGATVFMPIVGGHIPEFTDTSGWRELYEERGILGNRVRTDTIVACAKLCAELHLPVVVLFYLLDHGRAMMQALQAAGLRADWVHGKLPLGAINDNQRRLAQGGLDVLLASNIFVRGINLPEARAWINAAGWRSDRATAQKLGRGVRRKDGDNRVLVVDPYDFANRILRRHSDKRARLYEREGAQVQRGHLSEIEAGIRTWAATMGSGS